RRENDPGESHVALHTTKEHPQPLEFRPPAGRRKRAHRHRNTLSATPKLRSPHTATIASRPVVRATGSPSIMTARSASFNAVRGNALMTGWIALGKLADEKNTPE